MILLNYWVIGGYKIEFFGYGNENPYYSVFIDSEQKKNSHDREGCYAFILDFIEDLNLS